MKITSLATDTVKLLTAAAAPVASADISVESMKVLTLEVWGAVASKSLSFEQQGEGSGAWYPINGVNTTLATPAAGILTTSTVGEIWTFDITGVKAFRVNLTAVTGGAVNAVARISLL